MHLTEQELKSITVGAVRTTYLDGGYHFSKYTEKQVRFFDGLSKAFGERARTTTGIRFDFHTSSDYIALETLTGGKYEVYVDGLLAEQFLLTAGGRIQCKLCGVRKEECRVTVVLPAHGNGVISYLEIADGATFYPHRFDRKLLFIGDSITQGWNADLDGFSFAYRLSFFYNADSVIQGTGGAFFHEDSFDSFDFAPDTVIVALGTNDFGHYATVEEMVMHANAHLALLAKQYAGVPLYYISPIWRANQQSRMGSFADARKALAEAAQKNGFTHVDGFSLVPPHAAFYTEDLLHPNTLGFTQYAENLIRYLGK